VIASSSEILQLIYVSAAAVPFTEQDLGSLLLRARVNNQRLNVSGLLIHHEGSFFQVLEGGPDSVNTLYERIARDKRHTRVLSLARGLVPHRTFGDWSMGFVAGVQAQLTTLPGFNDFLRSGVDLAHAADRASRAKDLALAFRSGRFRQFVEGR
jgi:Sensors of blue-light using FAD